MKKIIFTLIAILLGFTSYTQKVENNTVIITVKTEAMQTFNDFADHLLLNGFTFENRDERLKYILTDIKIAPVGKVNYRFRAYVQNNQITVTVEFQHYPYDINSGSTGPLMMKQWSYEKRGLGKRIYDEFIPVLQSFSTDISFITK